ncbi:unnamed protein product [Camellia sinensis]
MMGGWEEGGGLGKEKQGIEAAEIKDEAVEKDDGRGLNSIPWKMGVMLRQVLPICGIVCFFYPSLRARSRQSVKRYKNLLADIFPRFQGVFDALLKSEPRFIRLRDEEGRTPLHLIA